MALATKYGRWIERDADKHKCIYPTLSQSPGVRTGDVWQCNTCNKKFRVRVNYDQRDGDWLSWVETTPEIGVTTWRDR